MDYVELKRLEDERLTADDIEQLEREVAIIKKNYAVFLHAEQLAEHKYE